MQLLETNKQTHKELSVLREQVMIYQYSDLAQVI